MKKLIAIGLITLMTAAIIGCDAPEQNAGMADSWVNAGRCMRVRAVMIKGHEYILMSGFRCGGIVHAASCPCMGK